MWYMLQKSKIPRGIRLRNLRFSCGRTKVIFPHPKVPSGMLAAGTGNHREDEGTILCLGLNEYIVGTKQ